MAIFIVRFLDKTLKMKGEIMWQNWVNAILGIWIIISPYLGMTESGLKTTLVITGVVVLILAVWGTFEKNMMKA